MIFFVLKIYIYMETSRIEELKKIAEQRIAIATKHIENSDNQIAFRKSLNEESEIPGFESKPMKFGQFVNKEFVVMMTDIRKSTEIINAENGLVNMFKIFYAYSAVVANIVDKNTGTSTEFLGDGVLNLFDIENGNRIEMLIKAYNAADEILYARENILNPLFIRHGLPIINIGIGIDFGITIVTRFGYNSDNDLKAFGKCVYNVSKLCKGENSIHVSPNTQYLWPKSPTGTLQFIPTRDADGNSAYRIA